MQTIFKYKIPQATTGLIYLPKGAEILHVGVQRERQFYGEEVEAVFLWALVDLKQPLTPRKIRLVGTGWDLEESPGKYLGTVQINGGSYVWHVHVFEDKIGLSDFSSDVSPK